MVLLPGPRTVSVTATQTSKRKGKAPETSLAREREIKGPQAAQGAHNIPLAHKDGKIDFGQKPLFVTLLEQEVCAVTTVGKAKGRNETRGTRSTQSPHPFMVRKTQTPKGRKALGA